MAELSGRDDQHLERFLAGARVDPAVFVLRPDYRVVLIAVDGIAPGPSDAASEALLLGAEESAREALAAQPVDQLPQVASWREAYRAFGAKPQRTRNSLEALLRRAESGLPRVNRLTDIYNAVSVAHRIPLGGEDLSRYIGPPRLVRATGTEPFDTTANGEPITEHPEPGEVVWRDDAGVTCRRWNWRQTTRTQLRQDTTAALFILDALDPLPEDALHAAADDLLSHVSRISPGLSYQVRLIGGDRP
jgi:DNA/RNA-binding domain of Phe-tRNA-synthetase-like protein